MITQISKLFLILFSRKVINMNLKIFLNCQEGLSELPIKSFYRFVLDSEPIFETNGPRALFSNLPQHSLFTMAIVPPESWMVAAVEAEHDLGKIYCTKIFY